MPTLADIQAARPKCSRITGTEGRCDKPMIYSDEGNVWTCPKDGATVKGLLLAGWHAEPALSEAA